MPQQDIPRDSHQAVTHAEPVGGPNSVRVVAALRERFPAQDEKVTAELHGAVGEYVAHLKDGGYTPDQIVVLLDRVMFDVGMDTAAQSRGRRSTSITRLFIEEFQRPED